MIERDFITVPYAWELISVSMYYSQGDGLNTSLCRFYTVPTSHLSVLVSVVVVVWRVKLSSVARSCASQDDANRDYVRTPIMSSGIDRPPHPDHLAYT